MPIKSRWTCDIPKCSLLTYLFTTPTNPLSKDPLYIDCNNPDSHFLSTHAYRTLTLRIASGLIANGLQPGDPVLLFSGNNIFFAAIFSGVIAAGGVFTGANPGFTSRELAYQLKDSGAKFLIASKTSIDVAIDAARTAGIAPRNIFAFDDGLYMNMDGDVVKWESKSQVKGVRHWGDIVEAGTEQFKWDELRTDEECNRTAAINYSSGYFPIPSKFGAQAMGCFIASGGFDEDILTLPSTTGMPKGVEITHRNFIANAAQVLYVNSLLPAGTPHRWLCILPMFHAYGQTYYTIMTPLRQIPTYILLKFDFLVYLDFVQKFRITHIGGVPLLMAALAKHPDVVKYDLSGVVSIGSGAAPLSKDIADLVQKRISKGQEKIKVMQGWGMTEMTCTVLGWPPEALVESGSVGELFPNCEGKVVDTTDETIELPVSTVGEIWVRGPNIMKGYYKNPKATIETLTAAGWLKTGDIGYYNNLGRWFIVARKKELIKVKGNQVAPAELEGLLLEHPGIVDAAVIGVPFAEDERPRAYVVVKQGALITAEDVKKWVQGRAVKHKWITGGVMFEKEILRNTSGKILRRVLVEKAKTEAIDTLDYKARL